MVWIVLLTAVLVLFPCLLCVYGLMSLHKSEVTTLVDNHKEMVQELNRSNAERESGLRDEIKVLTESLVRAEGKFLVYPRKQPTEMAEGWFEGKPKIVSTGPLVAADAAIREAKGGK